MVKCVTFNSHFDRRFRAFDPEPPTLREAVKKIIKNNSSLRGGRGVGIPKLYVKFWWP